MTDDDTQGYTQLKLQPGQLEEDAFWILMGEKCMVTEWESMLNKLKERKGTVLEMEGANIGEVGLWALSRAIQDNPTISEVRYECVPFPTSWRWPVNARVPRRFGCPRPCSPAAGRANSRASTAWRPLRAPAPSASWSHFAW